MLACRAGALVGRASMSERRVGVRTGRVGALAGCAGDSVRRLGVCAARAGESERRRFCPGNETSSLAWTSASLSSSASLSASLSASFTFRLKLTWKNI